MEITPQILKKPNKYVQPVEKSTQISKIPNKRARDAHDESPQISKKPNKHVMDDYARVNVYDHNPNGNKSDFYDGCDGGING